MDLPPQLENLIADIGSTLGMPALALDGDGFCALNFDDSILVNIQYNPNHDALVLFSDLGPIPEERREDVLIAMLRGNRFWQATLGSTLSLSGDEEPSATLAIQCQWPHLTPSQLTTAIERFVNTAEDWANVIQNGVQGEGLAPMESVSDAVFMIRA